MQQGGTNVERTVRSTDKSTCRSARWRSPAKVNLCLRIVGRRNDGYHLLDSIFVPVDLCDRISVRVNDLCRGGEATVRVRCRYPGVPEDASNLAARAARALLAEAGQGAKIEIAIEKRIPPGAGLGGGSGNAATVLNGLNALLGLGLSEPRLGEIAIHLGADVPFFLSARSSRVRGIGEDVQPIVGWPDLQLVVAIPPLAVSSAWAFAAYRSVAIGEAGEEPVRLAAGAQPTADLLVNDLERVVVPAFPAVGRLKRGLLEAGATAAVMSGSGSAVVAVAPSAAAARRIAGVAREEFPGVDVRPVGVFRSEHSCRRVRRGG